jgi:hypothetical protein
MYTLKYENNNWDWIILLTTEDENIAINEYNNFINNKYRNPIALYNDDELMLICNEYFG